MDTRYQKTVYACFVGYIVQAIVNNFAPLLFLTFHRSYGIPLSRITFLVTFNFALQLLVDLVSVKFVDRIGYRAALILAHLTAAFGLVMLAVLPGILSDPYTGILIAVFFYAVGGGLLEVVVSPVMESCPTPNKEAAMSLLHSFYCWGHVSVVLLSTLFFAVFGIAHWQILAILWAVIPAVNMLVFTRVPIADLLPEGESAIPLGRLLKNRLFWLFVVLMICAGACEQAVSQWASTFAEQALGVTKTLGDHVFCHHDGNFPSDLRKAWGETSPEEMYHRQHAAVPCLLPDHIPLAPARPRPHRMRDLRFLSRDPVAGYVLHGSSSSAYGRHCHVRTAGSWRRCRLQRRSDLGRADLICSR